MGWRVDNELQQMLRDSAQGHLATAGGPGHVRQVRAAGNGFDAAAWASFGELGWTGVLLPESLGGSDLGIEPALTLAEELGRTIAPEPFVASAVIAATVLASCSAAAGVELAGALAQGQRSVTLAWQEARGTLGVPAFATRFAGGKLNGAKVHVPGWHDGAALLVAAAGDDGAVVVAVDPAAAGVGVTVHALTDGSQCADVLFDNVAIGADGVLLSGGAAGAALELAVARGTVALSAQLEGLAGELWRITLDYMKQRRQFGSALSDFQANRFQMVDLYSQIELAAASWRTAALALEAGETRGVAIHAAKARCSQAAQEMSRWAIQFHGAMGYTEEVDVGRYVHAALAWASWLGNAAAHRRAALAARRNSR